MKPVILNNLLNKNNLWNGCMLASIAHAIMVAHYPELSYEHSWDGINYSVVDDSGGRGTVTFSDKYCIAAFRNDNVTCTECSTAIDFFKGAPREVLRLAESETLEYLLEEGEDGISNPSITTAFWADGDNVISIDSIVKIIQNGGYLLERQLTEYEAAVKSWQTYYEMTNQQVALVESIYAKKIKNPNSNILLTRRESKMIGTENIEGLSESKTSFEEIGITWDN
ncbi:hypothetical protein [Metabacillus fastidiosus]|uniref:hypothetical protein n=1 Tax=Metabacillus fastidiosus TaxID=1458 RepID=UPI002E20175F|nr:hypothetical protein [Metabacillus fastidiosus]